MTTTISVNTHGHTVEVDEINHAGTIEVTTVVTGEKQFIVHSWKAIAIREVYTDGREQIKNVTVFKE